MKRLRMGYVGCGRLAQRVHIPNILSIENCELVALAELRTQLGELVQHRFRVPRLYPNHHDLADNPDIRAVAISAHQDAQGEIAIDLLKAGKDVFVEKPMAMSVEQAKRILAAERKSGRRLMVAYMKRYDPGNVRVKKLMERFLRTGELGRLRFVRNHGFCGDWIAGLDMPVIKTDEPYPKVKSQNPSWLPENHARSYMDYVQQYTHNVNLVRWLLDAGGDVKVKAVDLDRDHATYGTVILEVAGVRTVIESGLVAYHGWDEHTQAYFDGGWIRTDAPPLLLRGVPATIEVYRGNRPEKVQTQIFPDGGRLWSYKAEMIHFVDCVLTGKPFRSPASDTLHDVALFEEIFKRHVKACRK